MVASRLAGIRLGFYRLVPPPPTSPNWPFKLPRPSREVTQVRGGSTRFTDGCVFFLCAQSSANDGTVQFAHVPTLLRETWLHSLPKNLSDGIPDVVKNELRDIHSPQFPSQPTGVYPFVGWLWSDFFVHDDTTHLDFSRGRGFVFGKPVTEAWLASAGVVGMVRAHQHNNGRGGPMMDELIGGAGLVDNWGGAGQSMGHQSGCALSMCGQACVRVCVRVSASPCDHCVASWSVAADVSMSKPPRCRSYLHVPVRRGRAVVRISL